MALAETPDQSGLIEKAGRQELIFGHLQFAAR